jgi:hypothetical protein
MGKAKEIDFEKHLNRMFEQNAKAVAEYEAAHPKKRRAGKGANDPRNVIQPLPKSFKPTLASESMKAQGATTDGIVIYLKSYPNGTAVQKMAVGDNVFGSFTKARAFLDSLRAAAEKAAKPKKERARKPVIEAPVETPAADIELPVG